MTFKKSRIYFQFLPNIVWNKILNPNKYTYLESAYQVLQNGVIIYVQTFPTCNILKNNLNIRTFCKISIRAEIGKSYIDIID